MKVLWINDRADWTGGCEHYMQRSARGLTELHNVENVLLYAPGGNSNAQFLEAFQQAYPAVNLQAQVQRIQPDLIYVHRLPAGTQISDFTALKIPVLRFFHDHRELCLREHMYTAVKQQTCSKALGLGCISCLGFIERKGNGLALRSVSAHKNNLKAFAACDALVVASAYMAKQLEKNHLPAEKIQVLPLFAEPLFQEAVSSRTLKADSQKLLFIGQLVTGKGLDVLLKAMTQLPASVRLDVVGSGRQAERYQQLSEHLNLSKRVCFVGNKTQAEIQDFLKASDCVVVPSRAPETFALVGLEAMRQARPVIAADVGGVREWLNPGENGLTFPSGNAQELAQRIVQLFAHPERAPMMGQRGYQRWKSHFQSIHHIEKLFKLMLALMPQQSKQKGVSYEVR